MSQSYQTFDMIEEVTRNDGSSYYEITNVEQNGIAELACDRGMIKEVRILQLNIARTQALKTYEEYINKTYTFPTLTNLKEWTEWDKPKGKIRDAYDLILKSNRIG
ncbi:hypothetical protein [Lactobacillus psittaci]|uniref:Uncharacterized protein n=1 Tax=Lactobacillus psittaci DSM 15354 TaxID=1122152 RepID=A0A0R1S1R1_9LACO|nr:hypothetical protein [Lactobacillus psittaci]KRL63040.1 hypothetical protein FC23_GL000977 [Lactobacillus psittaci DSM 15354]